MRRFAGPLSGFAAGVLVGFLVALGALHCALIEFDPKIMAGNVLQAAATILTGVFVAAYVQWSMQADKSQKEILTKQLENVLKLLDDLERFLEGAALNDVNATLKKLSVSCTTVNDILEHLKYPKAIAKDAALSAGVKEMRAATETPIRAIEEEIGTSAVSARVRDGILELANDRKLLLATKLHLFRMRVFKMQIAVTQLYPAR